MFPTPLPSMAIRDFCFFEQYGIMYPISALKMPHRSKVCHQKEFSEQKKVFEFFLREIWSPSDSKKLKLYSCLNKRRVTAELSSWSKQIKFGFHQWLFLKKLFLNLPYFSLIIVTVKSPSAVQPKQKALVFIQNQTFPVM